MSTEVKEAELSKQPQVTAEPLPPLEELRINKLLVAIDGSESSEIALRAAVTAANRDNAAVTLIVVIPDYAVESAHWALAGTPSPAGLQEDADDHASALLRQTVDRMPNDIPATTVLRHGKAGPEIVAFAKEQGDFDAILVGARGLGRIRSMMGSVSSHVLHSADTAVFVAHEPGDGE